MKNKKILSTLAFVAILSFALWKSGIVSRWQGAHSTPAEVAQVLEKNSGTLIDVREISETDQGTIQGAKLWPLSELRANPEQAMTLFGKPSEAGALFLFCRSGNRSAQAAKILKELGYTVSNAGGYDDLIAAGLPSTKK